MWGGGWGDGGGGGDVCVCVCVCVCVRERERERPVLYWAVALFLCSDREAEGGCAKYAV